MAEQGQEKSLVAKKLDFGDEEEDAGTEIEEEVDDKEKAEMQALQGDSLEDKYEIISVIHYSKPDQDKTKGYQKIVPPEAAEVDLRTDSQNKGFPETSA